MIVKIRDIHGITEGHTTLCSMMVTIRFPSSVVMILSGFGTSGITLNGLIDEGPISGGSADTSVGGAWAWFVIW